MRRHGFRFLVAAAITMIPLALSAQSASERTAETVPDDARHLRALVERALANQAEIQQVSLSLGARQHRMLQLTAQLDMLREDLLGAGPALAALQGLLRTAKTQASEGDTIEARSEAAGLLPLFQSQLATVERRAQELRGREQQLLEQLQTEEAQWNELAVRLTRLSMP